MKLPIQLGGGGIPVFGSQSITINQNVMGSNYTASCTIPQGSKGILVVSNGRNSGGCSSPSISGSTATFLGGGSFTGGGGVATEYSCMYYIDATTNVSVSVSAASNSRTLAYFVPMTIE